MTTVDTPTPRPERHIVEHDDYLRLLDAAMNGTPIDAAELVAITMRTRPEGVAA